MRSQQARRRRGATTVEAAICFPILFVLICMIFQLGHIYFVKNQLEMSCREAARLGATEGITSLEAKAKIMEIMSPIVLGYAVDCSINDDQIEFYPAGGDEPFDASASEAAWDKFNSKMQILVKDASIYDTGGPYPASESEILSLPEGELSEMEPRQLFSIRAEIIYKTPFAVPGLSGASFSNERLLPGDLVMSTYSFSRHE